MHSRERERWKEREKERDRERRGGREGRDGGAVSLDAVPTHGPFPHQAGDTLSEVLKSHNAFQTRVRALVRVCAFVRVSEVGLHGIRACAVRPAILGPCRVET